MNKMKCSGCGQEPHPNIPCGEAKSLRAPKKWGWKQDIYVVWYWHPRHNFVNVGTSSPFRGVALGFAADYRKQGWKAKIKKSTVFF